MTHEEVPVDNGCINGCSAPFGVRCSVCNTEKRQRRTLVDSVGFALCANDESARHAATGTAPATPTTEPAYEDVPLPPEPFDEFEFT